jgi:hypothetical protein
VGVGTGVAVGTGVGPAVGVAVGTGEGVADAPGVGVTVAVGLVLGDGVGEAPTACGEVVPPPPPQPEAMIAIPAMNKAGTNPLQVLWLDVMHGLPFTMTCRHPLAGRRTTGTRCAVVRRPSILAPQNLACYGVTVMLPNMSLWKVQR